ncbi:MAG: hypothetical protein ACYC1W_10505, partial [Gemmatimonadaceae bacterium]
SDPAQFEGPPCVSTVALRVFAAPDTPAAVGGFGRPRSRAVHAGGAPSARSGGEDGRRAQAAPTVGAGVSAAGVRQS